MIVSPKIHFASFLTASVFVFSTFGETINVDDDGGLDFTNIQDAIDSASNGDTILVHPGTYSARAGDGSIISLGDKELVIQAADPANRPVLDGGGNSTGAGGAQGIWIVQGQTSATVIDGLIVQHCQGGIVFGGYYGGGLFVYQASPTIQNCDFQNNIAQYGAGVMGFSTSSTFTNCSIRNNNAVAITDVGGDGGGVLLNGTINPSVSTAIFTGCNIESNTAASGGGGAYISYYGSVQFIDSNINNNDAQIARSEFMGGGINCFLLNDSVSLLNTTVAGNTPDQIFGEWNNANDTSCVTTSAPGTDTDGDGILDGCGQAGVYTVDDDGSADFDSIQSAIDFAASGSTIQVAPGTYTGSGFWVVNPGGKELTITSTGGPSVTIIDGQNQRRGVHFSAGESAILDGFTVTNGSDPRGAGVYSGWASPIISNCVVSGNNCVTDQGIEARGGGIYIVDADSTLVEQTVVCGNVGADSNDQVYGSYINGGLNCVTVDCSDTDADGIPDACQVSDSDGVLYVPSEYASIDEAVWAASSGDEILVAAGTYTSTGSSVLNPGGKAITIRAANPDDRPVLDGENARRVVVCTSSEGSDTVIAGFIIQNGLTEFEGGGINCNGSSPTIKNCDVISCSASKNGGGIRLFDNADATLENVSVRNSSTGTGDLSNYNIGAGGGLYVFDSSPVIANSEFSSNTASWGGGACFFTSTGGQMIGGSLTSNSAVAGGALYIYNNSSLSVQGGSGRNARLSLDQNSLTAGGDGAALGNHGGGAFVMIGSALTLNQVDVVSNSGANEGGGLYVTLDSQASATNCAINNNLALSGGGVAVARKSSMSLVTSTVSGNTATVDGGGVTVAFESTFNVSDSNMSENTSEGAGVSLGIKSAMRASGSSSTDSLTFTNRAAVLSLASSSTLTVKGNLVQGDSAILNLDVDAGQGSGLVVTGSSVRAGTVNVSDPNRTFSGLQAGDRVELVDADSLAGVGYAAIPCPSLSDGLVFELREENGNVAMAVVDGYTPTFVEPDTADLPGVPLDVQVMDFENDGIEELAILTGGEEGSITIQGLGGDGTMQALDTIPVGANPIGMDVADLNGDGHQDFLVINQDSGRVRAISYNPHDRGESPWSSEDVIDMGDSFHFTAIAGGGYNPFGRSFFTQIVGGGYNPFGRTFNGGFQSFTGGYNPFGRNGSERSFTNNFFPTDNVPQSVDMFGGGGYNPFGREGERNDAFGSGWGFVGTFGDGYNPFGRNEDRNFGGFGGGVTFGGGYNPFGRGETTFEIPFGFGEGFNPTSIANGDFGYNPFGRNEDRSFGGGGFVFGMPFASSGYNPFGGGAGFRGFGGGFGAIGIATGYNPFGRGQNPTNPVAFETPYFLPIDMEVVGVTTFDADGDGDNDILVTGYNPFGRSDGRGGYFGGFGTSVFTNGYNPFGRDGEGSPIWSRMDFQTDEDGDQGFILTADLDGNGTKEIVTVSRQASDLRTVEGEVTYAPIPSNEVSCPGDVTGDNAVDVLDLLEVIGNFGGSGGAADANGDGSVDVLDLLEVIGNFGSSC